MVNNYRNSDNPAKTKGFLFIEYASEFPQKLEQIFINMGLVLTARHKKYNIDLWQKNDIVFLLNKMKGGFAENFTKKHGDGVCGFGFFVENANSAYNHCISKEAKLDNKSDKWYLSDNNNSQLYAIQGIADTRLYIGDKFLTDYDDLFKKVDCVDKNSLVSNTPQVLKIDHITHNVFRGNMNKYADFYKSIFNFRQVRYFDIEGKLTGLLSRAMTSPCGNIRIPINESSDDQSQIEEFIKSYSGEGVQHIALSTNDIYGVVPILRKSGVEFMDTPNSYYDATEKRLPYHNENINALKKLKILIDGDIKNGKATKILLQIFTTNIIGPLFFEIIQRKGNEGFGEGNFKALFESIESDQIARGVIQ